MSLQTTKRVYYLSIIVLAGALICAGGVVEWIVATVMLSGALPMYAILRKAAEISGARSALQRLRENVILDELLEQDLQARNRSPQEDASEAHRVRLHSRV